MIIHSQENPKRGNRLSVKLLGKLGLRRKIKRRIAGILLMLDICTAIVAIGVWKAELSKAMSYDIPMTPLVAEVMAAEQNVSIQDWVFDEVERALGKTEAIKAMGIIQCESRWRPDIVILEPNGSASLGLWQINTIHNKRSDSLYISNADKLDYKLATDWAIRKRKADGNWNAWTCAK